MIELIAYYNDSYMMQEIAKLFSENANLSSNKLTQINLLLRKKFLTGIYKIESIKAEIKSMDEFYIIICRKMHMLKYVINIHSFDIYQVDEGM